MTFAEFLQNTPPNQLRNISDLAVRLRGGVGWTINMPELKLDCPDDSCDGFRVFRRTISSFQDNPLDQNTLKYLHLTYQCSNCMKTQKVYSLAARFLAAGSTYSRGTCYKLGEDLPYGPRVPSRLIRLIGPDRNIFIQGQRCENQGLGIGAFTYYRRVVENKRIGFYRK